MSTTNPDSNMDNSEHEIRGIGEETRVDCGRHGTIYGPHPDAEGQFDYCPYCGEDADNDNHDTSVARAEVICENTGMSTYRYCPGCGTKVGDSQ